MQIKYYDYGIALAEFPDEISLCVNISNCPGLCDNCSEPWLREDVGTILDEEEITHLIDKYPDITCFGFMGGDNNISDIVELSRIIHKKYPKIKVGMYSGKDYLQEELFSVLDYYKIGKWIMPKGDVSLWHTYNNGPLVFPWSNQLMFKKESIGNKTYWINITDKFRKTKINNPERFIM